MEQGKIVLSAPVSDYWPEFKQNGKELVTIRELMTHYSGLPPDLALKPAWTGYDTAMKMIVATKLNVPPGTRFIYSDINFETLGEIVRRVSGEPLDVYCAEHIFNPLGMKDTAVHASRLAPYAHCAHAIRAWYQRTRALGCRARSHVPLHGRRGRARGPVLHRRRRFHLRANAAEWRRL